MTRVNICRVNKARSCSSPLRNGICNDTAPLMFLSQYNMYLNEDERRPVRARPRRCSVEGSWPGGCLWKRCIEVGSGAREITRRVLAPLGATRVDESWHPEVVTWVSEAIRKPSAQTQGWREVSCSGGHGVLEGGGQGRESYPFLLVLFACVTWASGRAGAVRRAYTSGGTRLSSEAVPCPERLQCQRPGGLSGR